MECFPSVSLSVLTYLSCWRYQVVSCLQYSSKMRGIELAELTFWLMLELGLPSLHCERPKTRDASALTFDWFGWDICSVNTRTSSRRRRGSCSDCCAILARRQGLLTRDKILSADCLGLVAQKKANRYSRLVIFFLIQRFLFFFFLNSYYKSRMVVFHSRIVISISHTVIFESHVVVFQSHIVISQSHHS